MKNIKSFNEHSIGVDIRDLILQYLPYLIDSGFSYWFRNNTIHFGRGNGFMLSDILDELIPFIGMMREFFHIDRVTIDPTGYGSHEIDIYNISSDERVANIGIDYRPKR